MKQFGTIFKFEVKYYFKNKSFIGVTALFVVLLAVVLFAPRIDNAFSSDDGGIQTEDTESRPIMLIVAESPESTDAIATAFSSAFPDYEVRRSSDGIDAVKEQIISGEVECAFAFESFTSYTYYVNNLSMYDTNTAVADELMKNVYRMNAMVAGGIPTDTAEEILAAEIEFNIESLGKDQMQSFFYAYIMIFALYMVILLYGQMVATNVATEKSSRAMELLVTSAKPSSMMFGKVMASCLAGFIQLAAVFGSAYLFYGINKSYWEGSEIAAMLFDIPPELLGFMLVFFVLGFLIYAFLFGAIGSTASKLEDINTSVMPLMMLFIVGFVVAVSSMSGGDVDSTLMKVCSFVPFTSPMAMFTRIALSTVPVGEIIISIALLVASVVGIGFLSAKIYRVGVLLYGTPPKLSAILKAIRKA